MRDNGFAQVFPGIPEAWSCRWLHPPDIRSTGTLRHLTTGQGVIIVDAPPNTGEKILAAVASVTDEPITHVIFAMANTSPH